MVGEEAGRLVSEGRIMKTKDEIEKGLHEMEIRRKSYVLDMCAPQYPNSVECVTASAAGLYCGKQTGAQRFLLYAVRLYLLNLIRTTH